MRVLMLRRALPAHAGQPPDGVEGDVPALRRLLAAARNLSAPAQARSSRAAGPALRTGAVLRPRLRAAAPAPAADHRPARSVGPEARPDRHRSPGRLLRPGDLQSRSG